MRCIGRVQPSAAFFKAMIRIGFLGLLGAAVGNANPAETVPLQESTPARAREEAVSSDPESGPEAMEKRGDLYMARKYFAEAVEVYKKALLLQPKNAALYNKSGIAYHQLLDYESAKKSYRKAIQLNPRFAQAVNNLAAVEYAQKHYKASVLTYLKALKLSPGDAVIYSNLGTSYFALDRFDYAVAAYRYALQLDPTVFQRAGRVGTIVHQRDEKNAAAFNFYMAKTYADMQDLENTLLYLRKAWEEKFPEFRKALQDKVFAYLGAEPKFVEFLAEMDSAEMPKAGADRAK